MAGAARMVGDVATSSPARLKGALEEAKSFMKPFRLVGALFGSARPVKLGVGPLANLRLSAWCQLAPVGLVPTLLYARCPTANPGDVHSSTA
jgi:hypothetical protein